MEAATRPMAKKKSQKNKILAAESLSRTAAGYAVTAAAAHELRPRRSHSNHRLGSKRRIRIHRHRLRRGRRTCRRQSRQSRTPRAADRSRHRSARSEHDRPRFSSSLDRRSCDGVELLRQALRQSRTASNATASTFPAKASSTLAPAPWAAAPRTTRSSLFIRITRTGTTSRRS